MTLPPKTPYTPEEDANIIDWRINRTRPISYREIGRRLDRHEDSVRRRAMMLGCVGTRSFPQIKPVMRVPMLLHESDFIKPIPLARLMGRRA